MIHKLVVIAYNHSHSIPNPAAPMRFFHGLRPRLLVGLITLMFTGQEAVASDAAELRALAEQKLHESLKADSVYVRVHATEALISEGLVQRARDSFLAEALAAEMVPIRRVVTWRGLAQVATDAQQRERWINRLKAVALDPAAEDRTHAVESLAKLSVLIPANERAVYDDMARQSKAGYSVFALWILYHSGETDALDRIAGVLASNDPIMRLRAAYIIRREKVSSAAVLSALGRTLETEPLDSPAYPYLLSAATLLETNPDRCRELLAKLEHIAFNGPHGARYEACQTLMNLWAPADAPRLAELLVMDQTDSLVAGAWAILHLTSPLRNSQL